MHVARPTSSPAFLRGPRGPQIRAAAAAQMVAIYSPCVPASSRARVPLVRPTSSPAFLRRGAARQPPQRPTAIPRVVYAHEHEVLGPSSTREERTVQRNPITHQRIYYQDQSNLRHQPTPPQRPHSHVAGQRVGP